LTTTTLPTDTLPTYLIITKNSSGDWMKTATNEYTYYVDSTHVKFDYNSTNSMFTCSGYNKDNTQAKKDCSKLVQ